MRIKKKNLCLALLCFLSVSLTNSVLGLESGDPAKRDSDKAVHGVINLLTFPLEVPMQMYKGARLGVSSIDGESRGLSRFAGMVSGLAINGPYKAAGRAWMGVYQLSTFWALTPNKVEEFGFPLDSEFAFEFEEPQDRTVGEEFRFMANKLRRGLCNILWGTVVELPSNVSDGWKIGKPVQGFVKGSWNMTSRILSGAYELVGSPLPNHWETVGYTFEEDEPWTRHFNNDKKPEYSFAN